MNATAEDQHDHDTTLQAGQVLDHKYRVDYLVGQGGMAAVWAGTNERTGKRVALKVLLRSFSAKPGTESLIQREVLAASRVDHPNVVTVFDVIEHHGMACIVMELLAGETLDRHLARVGKLSMNEAHRLLLPAMRGVAAAHAQGVIHADLKPQNIFICVGPDGRPVTTKVLDFGISQIAERSRDPSAKQTTVMGTPAYMAPEQLADSAPIDRRADVYGFGVILYEALAGQVPFPGKPGADLFERIVTQPAPPLAELRPDLTPSFVRIIDTALVKDPALRHPCLEAMIGAFEDEFLPETPPPTAVTWPNGVPVATPPEGTPCSQVAPGQAVSANPPAEDRRSTKVLVRFPRDKHARRRRSGSESHDGEGVLADGQASEPEIPPSGVLHKVLAKIRHPAHPRAWQGLAGIAIAGLTAGIVFLLWPATGAGSKTPANLPALAVQSGPLAAPPVSPTSDPVVAPAAPTPEVEQESPALRPAGLGTPAVAVVTQPTVPERIGLQAVAPDAKSVKRASPKKAAIRRAAARATPHGKASSPQPVARPTKADGATRLRAGSLSADDF